MVGQPYLAKHTVPPALGIIWLIEPYGLDAQVTRWLRSWLRRLQSTRLRLHHVCIAITLCGLLKRLHTVWEMTGSDCRPFCW
jgi:hypothetical protein